jgi:MTH538 TIR-like domain (DUF1863)
MSGPGLHAAGSAGGKIRVFASYDPESDGDLCDLLIGQAALTGARFEVSAQSNGRFRINGEAALRRAIRESDHVIVLCGEHTDCSESVGTELRIAKEEERPYLLLWGRRERMCTKPLTAKPADAMYSWTSEILEHQLLSVLRAAWTQEQLAEVNRHRFAQARTRTPRAADSANRR